MRKAPGEVQQALSNTCSLCNEEISFVVTHTGRGSFAACGCRQWTLGGNVPESWLVSTETLEAGFDNVLDTEGGSNAQ